MSILIDSDVLIWFTERARLLAIAVDRDRLAAQRPHDEVRNDAAVVRMHPRAVGVEDARQVDCRGGMNGMRLFLPVPTG